MIRQALRPLHSLHSLHHHPTLSHCLRRHRPMADAGILKFFTVDGGRKEERNSRAADDAEDQNGSQFRQLPQLMPEDWREVLKAEFKKPYFTKLIKNLEAEEKRGEKIFPPFPKIFAAFQATPFEKVKVVIIGQDPYHGDGQAEGMAFSVPEGVPVPSSLRNIYKELETDLREAAEAEGDEDPGKAFTRPGHGHLKAWADQGVLLLNTSLTVRAHKANSHKNFGWQKFTDSVIQAVNRQREDVVFLLWGKHAQMKGAAVDKKRHLVLESAHPSGLSAHRGFFGSRFGSKTNDYLVSKGKTPINWQL